MSNVKATTRHTDGAIALLRELNGGHEPYAPAVGFVQQWLAEWECAALAAARAEGAAEAYERAAEYCEAQAFGCECADDTMRGVNEGRPYRKMAAAIRALAAEEGRK